MDFAPDGYLPIVQTIEGKALAMEKQMLVSFLERAQIRRPLRRKAIMFQRALLPTIASRSFKPGGVNAATVNAVRT